jgi:serine/threonine protein kinase
MAAQLGAHPSADALHEFAVGKLDDITAAAITSHIDGCPDCCRAVAGLPGDDFLDRLRQAHSTNSTPDPAETPASGALGAMLSRQESQDQGPAISRRESMPPLAVPPLAVSPIANLPPELANNPQYKVLRELGRGGMGVVYLAKNKLMDRLEVLKVVNKALLDRPGAGERFLREIRAAAKLNHFNVVGAYSAVQAGELLAFAMEYVDGEDLAKLVQTQGPLPVVQACDYVQQAALGLQHAFEREMVHRDIKPQNLIRARDGLVKILDFGLAKVRRAKSGNTSLTDDGTMLGTPDYVAPEQTLDAANADIRADIYSLGCTLYYLLTGAPPFKGQGRDEVVQAHLSMEAKPLTLLRPEVPVELAAVVRKMMAKDPAQRYQTPMALVDALEAFVEKERDEGRGASEQDRKSRTGAMLSRRELQEQSPAGSGRESMPLPQREATPPVTEETLTASGTKSIGERRPPVRKPSLQRKWLIGGTSATGLLLLGLFGLWAAGVIRLQTPEGTLVVKVNVPNPDVYVDGRKITVRWDKGGKKAEIRVPAGTRDVEVTKDGFAAHGERVTLSDGGNRVVDAWLEQQQRVGPGPGGQLREKAAGTPVDEARRAGEERDDNDLKLKLCWCPTGTRPGFWIGKYEVTQSEWARLIGSMPSQALDKGKGDRHPIYYVSHADATEFCRKLTDLERNACRLSKGWAYRLPTDLQWEYACRAGTTTATAFGDTLDSTQANFNAAPNGPNRGEAVEVGSFRPNVWGIYDMHGNVGEFTATPGRHRGGSWYDSGRNCGSEIFIPDPPNASEHVGFRVALVESKSTQ